MKTILIFNATEISCGEHRKFKPFVGNCFAVSQLDEISVAQKKRRFETNYFFFSQKHVVYRLMYSQYENPNTLIWGKRNCRRTIEGCLVFKWIVT